MPLFFKSFDSKMASREKLFKAAVEYANQLGRERILTLSHSEDRDNIVITIWYWADEEMKPTDLKKAAAQAARAPSGKPGEPSVRSAGSAPSSDLALGLSGGFAGLKKPMEAREDDLLTRTPTTPPSLDDSLP
jgi:hypothetical protein